MRRLAVLLLALAACSVENPTRVQDTTGASLDWECELGACRPVGYAGAPEAPECDGPTELLVGAGALGLLCAVDDTDAPFPETCRPLACALASDCPQWGDRLYVCLGDICQIEDASGWTLDRVDVTALCLFDVPRHASCDEALADPAVAERLALVDEVCDGDRCTAVPLPCLQP